MKRHINKKSLRRHRYHIIYRQLLIIDLIFIILQVNARFGETHLAQIHNARLPAPSNVISNRKCMKPEANLNANLLGVQGRSPNNPGIELTWEPARSAGPRGLLDI